MMVGYWDTGLASVLRLVRQSWLSPPQLVVYSAVIEGAFIVVVAIDENPAHLGEPPVAMNATPPPFGNENDDERNRREGPPWDTRTLSRL